LPLVGGGIHRVARLFEHIRGEQSPGFIRSDQEHAALIGDGDATITLPPPRPRQTVVLPTFHDFLRFYESNA
jgi:hypothetical protein